MHVYAREYHLHVCVCMLVCRHTEKKLLTLHACYACPDQIITLHHAPVTFFLLVVPTQEPQRSENQGKLWYILSL